MFNCLQQRDASAKTLFMLVQASPLNRNGMRGAAVDSKNAFVFSHKLWLTSIKEYSMVEKIFTAEFVY